MRPVLLLCVVSSLLCGSAEARTLSPSAVGSPVPIERHWLHVPPSIRIFPYPHVWAFPRFRVFRGPVLTPTIPPRPLSPGVDPGGPVSRPRSNPVRHPGQIII